MKRSKPVLIPAPAKYPPSPIAAELRKVLRGLGEDPDREGLRLTPARAAQALEFLTSGYTTRVDEILNGALFSVKYDEMVIVKDIEFFQSVRASPAAVLRQSARGLPAPGRR